MASQRGNVIGSILFTVFGGPGILLVFLPFWITHFHVHPGNLLWLQAAAAAVLILAGLAPILESIIRFVFVGHGTLMPVAPPRHLVVSGFYRFVRNPMYVGVLMVLAGEAILFWSGGVTIEAVLAFLGFNVFILFHEEPSLIRRYPHEFSVFKRNVPRWLPRLTPWSSSRS